MSTTQATDWFYIEIYHALFKQAAGFMVWPHLHTCNFMYMGMIKNLNRRLYEESRYQLYERQCE
jgi:hypothetical protein